SELARDLSRRRAVASDRGKTGASVLQWCRSSSGTEALRCRSCRVSDVAASMGPFLVGNGDACGLALRLGVRAMLQWSRSSSGTDTMPALMASATTSRGRKTLERLFGFQTLRR